MAVLCRLSYSSGASRLCSRQSFRPLPATDGGVYRTSAGDRSLTESESRRASQGGGLERDARTAGSSLAVPHDAEGPAAPGAASSSWSDRGARRRVRERLQDGVICGLRLQLVVERQRAPRGAVPARVVLLQPGV